MPGLGDLPGVDIAALTSVNCQFTDDALGRSSRYLSPNP
jgi:hypothetical protein